MITVFTSCYNQGAYLSQAIESVLGQTYSDFEYLIFDDGSTDNTWDLIQNFKKIDKRIVPFKLCKTPNVGHVINASLAKSTKHFWTWLPADDLFEKNILKRKIEVSEKYKHKSILYSYWDEIDNNGKFIREKIPETLTPKQFAKVIWERCPIGFTGIWIPLEIFKIVGLFPTHLICSEDYYWMLKATIYGIPFRCVEEKLYKKRIHQNRTTARNVKGIMNKVAQIRNELTEHRELKEWWDEQHSENNKRYLTGSSSEDVWNFLNIKPMLIKGMNVLNIGVGLGYDTMALHKKEINVYALDISELAINRVRDVIKEGWLVNDISSLPDNFFDLSISYLVAQHMSDNDVVIQIKNVLRSLKKDRIFAMQFASSSSIGQLNSDINDQKKGSICRDLNAIKELVKKANGRIIWISTPRYFKQSYWYAIHIKGD